MKILFALLFSLSAAHAQTTYTSHYNLAKPADGSLTWGSQIRDDFDLIDVQMYINATGISTHIAAAAGAHAATAISSVPGAALCTSSMNVQTFLTCLDANIGAALTGGAVTVAGDQTITGAKTFSALMTGNAGFTLTSGALTLPTNTGVLHSNGGGLISSSLVDLAVDVTGTLPAAQGGTGVVSTATFPGNGVVAVVPASGVVKSNGSVLSSGNVSLSSEVTGTLAVASGGTGISSSATFPASGIVGTVPSSGVVRSNGSVFSSGAVALGSEVSGTLPGTSGGTGISSTATFPPTGTVAVVPSSGVVKSNGTTLTSGNVNLTSEVTGVLPVANGGSGVSSLGTANQILGVNAAANAPEYKSIVTGTAGNTPAIVHTANTLTINIPVASTSANGTVTSVAQTFSGDKTFNDSITAVGKLYLSTGTTSTVGTAVTLSSPGTPVRKLTGSTLVSIAGINPANVDGQVVSYVNLTGNPITVLNESPSAASAADRIRTGTNADVVIPSTGTFLMIYLTTGHTRWQMIGGGGGGSSRTVTAFTGTAVAPTTTSQEQTFIYTGVSAQTGTTSFFGTISGLANGTRVTVMGSDDTNTITIPLNDASNGWIMNGPWEGYRGSSIVFEYNSTLARMVEIGRN